MRRLLMVGLFTVVLSMTGMISGSRASAQQCMRLSCSTSQACQASSSAGGPCCCDVSCQIVGNELKCACVFSCNKACTENCPGCPGQQGAPGASTFAYTPELHDALVSQHPLAALILTKLSREFEVPIASQVIGGKSNAGVMKGEYSYRGALAADESHLTLDFVYDSVDSGPVPEPIRVEITAQGIVSAAVMSPSQIEAVRSKSSICEGGESATGGAD